MFIAGCDHHPSAQQTAASMKSGNSGTPTHGAAAEQSYRERGAQKATHDKKKGFPIDNYYW
jgi:hypothetical protein